MEKCFILHIILEIHLQFVKQVDFILKHMKIITLKNNYIRLLL